MASLREGLPGNSQHGIRKMAEAVEDQTSAAMERLIAGEGFSELLVWLTENIFALTNIGAGMWELMLRNMRLAGRRDINRLAHQMLRTEDKLELLLQAIERLEERQASIENGARRPPVRPRV